MNISITRTKEYRTKYGELKSSISRTVKGKDMGEISAMFCVDDVNCMEVACSEGCMGCWIDELQEYNRIIDANGLITFEKVERVQNAK